MFLRSLASLLLPKCSSNPNTAPAHSHATGVAVYPALFFSQGREDRTNHRIEEMIRDMAPIPIRKASYKNLKALLEMEKEMEDQEELFKV